MVRKFIELPAGRLTAAFNVDGLDDPAALDCISEDPRLRPAQNLGQVQQFHFKTRVRTVDTEPVHDFAVGNPRKGYRHLSIHGEREQVGHHPLHDIEQTILRDERHLNIDLREFWLTVGPQVLIPETVNDLEVSVIPRDHEELFEQLRRLGESVHETVVHPAGHQIVPGALRCALR